MHLAATWRTDGSRQQTRLLIFRAGQVDPLRVQLLRERL